MPRPWETLPPPAPALPPRRTTTPTGLVFFSVPYDDGFTAAINGKTAKIEKVDNGLMALRVPAGQTSITCTYHTPGLRTGTIISLAALAVYGAYLVVLKRKKCL